MILSLAGAVGQIRRQADYTYVWHQGNWTAETSETSTQMYLADQGWGNLSSLSTYLLLQSLDRLAVYSMAGEVPEETWRLGVEGSLDTFWPVIDAKGHRILRRLPPSLRGAMIATRGGGNGPRRMVRFLKAASFPAREMHQVDSFTAFEIGRSLVSTPLDVSERLLPALADVAPPEAQPQIEYWRSCVSRVACRYSRHGE